MFSTLISCTFLFPTLTSALFIIGVKEVHVEKLVQCPDKNTSATLNYALLNYQKTIMTVNAQFTLNQPVGGKTDLILELIKCQVKGEDTCEFNSRHRVVLDCNELHAQNKMWTEFVQHIPDLPGKCPIPAGKYNMTETPVSLSNMERLPLHIGYWKILANGFNKRKLVFCIAAEVDIQIQRKRKIG